MSYTSEILPGVIRMCSALYVSAVINGDKMFFDTQLGSYVVETLEEIRGSKLPREAREIKNWNYAELQIEAQKMTLDELASKYLVTKKRIREVLSKRHINWKGKLNQSQRPGEATETDYLKYEGKLTINELCLLTGRKYDTVRKYVQRHNIPVRKENS